MLIKSINVQWKTKDSILNDQGKFRWLTNSLVLSSSHQDIETQLNWPIGTIDAYNAAFGNKLSRFDTWDLGDLSSGQQQALKSAAKYYKRGVPWIDQTEQSPRQMQRGSYDIEIYSQETTLAKIVQSVSSDESFVIIDRHVYNEWNLCNTFPNAFLIDAREEHKTLSIIGALVQNWQLNCPQKKSWLLIGGGIVGDVGGFAASICNASFCLVPTSLLAMADACIGGKTGVNFPPFGKNQIGAFSFPSKVIVWPGWLKTLDARQLHSGASECFKHYFLADNKALCERTISALTQMSLADFDHILPDTILVKAAIISADADERGIRAILNLGHTLAHALESLSAKRQSNSETILHGEAVAVGLVFSAVLSNNIGILPDYEMLYIIDVLKRSSCLPSSTSMQKFLHSTSLFGDDLFDEMYQFIEQDKKNYVASSRQSQWVLLERLGKVQQDSHHYTTTVPYHEIKKSWLCMRQYLGEDQ